MPTRLALAVLCAAILALLFVGLSRANEVFVLRVRDRRIRFVRGRMPQKLFDEIEDIVRRHPDSKGSIFVVSEGGSPQVKVQGNFSGSLVQQLRNTVNLYPLVRLRAGSRPR